MVRAFLEQTTVAIKTGRKELGNTAAVQKNALKTQWLMCVLTDGIADSTELIPDSDCQHLR